MLALDIWIDKLIQWQDSGYKLEMPQKEKVDPLKWNNTLRLKLSTFMKDDIQYDMPFPAPKPDVNMQPESKIFYFNYLSSTSRIKKKNVFCICRNGSERTRST